MNIVSVFKIRKSTFIKYADFCIVLIIFLLLSSHMSYAAPKSVLWPKWEAHDFRSSEMINHQTWGVLLKKYLVTDHPSGVNRFKYAELSSTDKKLLYDYIDSMQTIAISAHNRKEQKAYWINLYNALTIKTIMDNYPVTSIREIGFLGNGPWDDKVATVEKSNLSLNDIEHRILRPIWKDNRIHYAVNCASIGCPNLLPEVYTAENTNALLDQSAAMHINHPRGLSFISKDRIRVSSLYTWYSEDFENSREGLLKHLTKYAGEDLLKKLKGFDGNIRYYYDWALNEP